jgi:hypothetical protein
MGIQINGNTDTITAIDGALTVSGAELAGTSNINVAGIITATGFVGNVTGNVTGNLNSTGVSTFSSISATTVNATTVNATRLVGVSSAGITTAYITSINDGPISGARNRIINGDMRIDQRNNGAAVTFNTTTDGTIYIVDRWNGIKNSNNKAYTIQRSGVAPVGFTSSLLMTVTSTNGSTGSSDYNIIRQFIEGYNVSDLIWGTANARPVTLSFWVRSSVTGTYSVSLVLQGSGNYPATYTINSANTWEYKTITVPGPTLGTWSIDNTIGLGVYFDMGIGSQYSTTTNTWTYGQNVFGGTGVTKLTQTNGATFYIAGVQLEAGTVATPFERRSYGEELALCQRYYETSDGVIWSSTGYHTAFIRVGQPFVTSKRVAPTMTYSNVTNSAGASVSIAAQNVRTTSHGWSNDGASTSYGLSFTYVADAEL